LVRSIWVASKVPGLDAPNDTAHLKVYYPAVYGGTLEERMSGIMPAASEGAPYPVVLFLSGVNIGQDSYRWLMIELAQAGYVAVTFDMVSEQTPGYFGTTPGLDLGVLTPDTYGTRPASIAIEPILATLAEQNRSGPLAGALDLDRIVIAGHSGGGTVAMESARASFFPACKATFSYSAHCVPADVLGFPKGTVLEVAPDIASLIMGGTADEVMRGSAVRYNEDGATRRDPVERTYTDGVAGGRDDAWFVLWDGANHFAMGDEDPTCARGFLDSPAPTDPDATRADMVDVVVAFLNAYVKDDAVGLERLEKFHAQPPTTVAEVRRK
jgi:dienelactone hydrolase